MKKRASLVLAVAALLAGVSAASAANMHRESAVPAVADVLNLNRVQQKVAWIDLSSGATSENASFGFKASAGSVVPKSVTIQAVTKKTASDVPALRSYDFAIVQGGLLVINPSDRKIAEVILPGYFFA
jgi:hypothetical protein